MDTSSGSAQSELVVHLDMATVTSQDKVLLAVTPNKPGSEGSGVLTAAQNTSNRVSLVEAEISDDGTQAKVCVR
jgi:hypothetical protein